jgi:hypothetical protein
MTSTIRNPPNFKVHYPPQRGWFSERERREGNKKEGRTNRGESKKRECP